MIEYLSGSVESYEKYPEKKYRDVAVLYRTNAQSRVIEEALINMGIPYKIIGGVRFYDRKEVKDVLAYLKVFSNPRDTVSWSRCINIPPRGIGKVTLEKIAESKYDLDLIDNTTKLHWKKYIELTKEIKATTLEILDAILKDFGYLDYLNDGTEESLYRIENLKELRTVANSYPVVSEFLETVALVESSSRAISADDDSVTLMTLHAAKGLEFETVFMVGMEEGIFPHSRSMTDPDELEEERRLCYVGITRAKKNLYMTYTRRRTYFGTTSGSIISRFVTEIPEDLLDFRYE
jgi:DNA helicase II / ATP-dependent DNA helicase PcrA